MYRALGGSEERPPVVRRVADSVFHAQSPLFCPAALPDTDDRIRSPAAVSSLRFTIPEPTTEPHRGPRRIDLHEADRPGTRCRPRGRWPSREARAATPDGRLVSTTAATLPQALHATFPDAVATSATGAAASRNNSAYQQIRQGMHQQAKAHWHRSHSDDKPTAPPDRSSSRRSAAQAPPTGAGYSSR